MVARVNPCCTKAELRAVLTDLAPVAADRKLESHLEECPVCREELERLAGGPQWWDDAKSLLSDADDRDDFDSAAIAVEAESGPDVSAADRAQLAAWLPAGLLEPSDDPAKIGRIGTYDVIDFIGRGGMGIVLKALDPALNRYVALKVLASELAHNASARRRFAREAQAAAAVVHDHVVPIYAVDGTRPIPYLVMAYIPGRSLQERIDQTGPLEVREILRIGMQAASGLAAAHAQGLVHRDIKPANILLENSVERVRITDFGLARAMDEASQTQSGILAGTPQYMAPEQASGEAIDFRADLFSLGSVLYAMCTGHSPFRAETTVAVLRRICDGAPRPVREVNTDVPEWLAAIIDRLLSKRPGDRFGSAEDVARLLAEHLAQLQQPSVRRSPWRLKWTALSAGVAAVTAAAVLLFGQFFGPSPEQRDRQDSQRQEDTQRQSAESSHAGAPIDDSRVSSQARSAPASRSLLDIDAIQAEMRALHEALFRLEATQSNGDTPWFIDPLREIDARLDALEHELNLP